MACLTSAHGGSSFMTISTVCREYQWLMEDRTAVRLLSSSGVPACYSSGHSGSLCVKNMAIVLVRVEYIHRRLLGLLVDMYTTTLIVVYCSTMLPAERKGLSHR